MTTSPSGFSVKGTESTRAQDLLQATFPERAGDSGQLVIHAPGGIDQPEVRARVGEVLSKIVAVSHVSGVTSPYDPEGARQIAPGKKIAYADIQFDERAGEVPDATATRIQDLARVGEQVDGVTLETGGRMFQTGGFQGSSELIGLLAASSSS